MKRSLGLSGIPWTALELLFVGSMMSVMFLLSAEESFPEPFNTEKSVSRPLPATEASAQLKLPSGFYCTAFASEPDVQQPIAMTTDPRGRLWVAENYTYSERSVGYHSQLRDRILVFEDTDNDGHFDKRTVFWDGAQRLTSIEVGLGGVWALCLPNLVFIPDKNGDEIPDAAPQVVLDGFEFMKARHTVANGLRWGPDGWLYGRQGILGTSLVGKPGTAKEQRTSMNVGIWRYHPQRQKFEVVAEGTTNPWGMDWDAHGEAFFINTVIGHLWQVIPGAHYRRMFGEDPNPHVYELIEQHADHVHWATGEVWTDVRKGVTDVTLAAGGGHAHTGLLIYQGGQWPSEWANKLLTINLHGRLINVERLEKDGSGFVGRREPDNFRFTDPWFRGIDLIAAPDGGVFVSDWSDTGECHDEDGIHRSSGRIFKIGFGNQKPRVVDNLTQLDGTALARLQLNENDWLSRQSRRVLADRANSGQSLTEAHAELNRIVAHEKNPVHRLRSLWALHISNGSSSQPLTELLSDPVASIRTWAIRLLEDQRHTDGSKKTEFSTVIRDRIPALAERESNANVRLTLASLLQKLAIEERPAIASALLGHSEDSNDHNIPLLLWYGIEPIATASNSSFEKLIASSRISKVQRLGARRLAEDIDNAPSRLDALLSQFLDSRDALNPQAALDGIADGLSGRRKAPKPAHWDAMMKRYSRDGSEALHNRLRDLSALFGDGRALDEIQTVALNEKADIPRRRAALQVLVEARAPGLRELCEKLLLVRDLSATAAGGLALSEDAAVADRLLVEWPNLYGHERPTVMGVLVSRPTWAARVLEAISKGQIQRSSLAAFQARQIRSYNQPTLTRHLSDVWGEVHEVDPARRESTLAKWRGHFTTETLSQGNKKQGQEVFRSLCAACHILNGEGTTIGPDLTGAARDNLEYLLDNILFPNAVVPNEYRLSTLTLKDGRLLSGVIRSRTEKTLKLQSATEISALESSEIASEETSSLSLMPEGLLETLDETQARNLMAYLMSKEAPSK